MFFDNISLHIIFDQNELPVFIEKAYANEHIPFALIKNQEAIGGVFKIVIANGYKQVTRPHTILILSINHKYKKNYA